MIANFVEALLQAWAEVAGLCSCRGVVLHSHVGDSASQGVPGHGQLRDEAAPPAAVAGVHVRPYRRARRGSSWYVLYVRKREQRIRRKRGK